MLKTKLDVQDKLDKQSNILRYLAEVEDKKGFSELLLEIAENISIIKYADCLKIEEEIENLVDKK